ASGSMGEEINSVQKKLTSMTDTLSKEIPELRIGVIIHGWSKFSEYPMSHSGNQLPFTSDFTEVKTFIDSLYATGGVEPWGDALYLAETWDWRPSAKKLIIMIGDEDCDPGKIVGKDSSEGFYNGSELLAVVTNLKDKGVIINTVVTDNPHENVVEQFGWISAYTDGESVFLPDLEDQGIDLPKIIEEWTLELGREFYQEMVVTITWQDGTNTQYRNSGTESFWLDTTFPSIIISEKITASGIDLFTVEFLAEVSDFSDILFVTLYHNAYDSWDVASMTPLVNSSYYLAELTNVPLDYNLSYSIEAADILHNSGETPEQWLIVEPTRVVVGEKNTILAEPNDQVFSSFNAEETNQFYLILSGEEVIDSIIVKIVYPGSSEQLTPSENYFQNVSATNWRKIFPLDFLPGIHTVNMTIPSDLDNFTFSYVWTTLSEAAGEDFTGKMTEEIRVQGLQWEATNGTYFSVKYNGSSPLVVLGEVYSTDWVFLGSFSVLDDLSITKNNTYYVIIWATLRTGDYSILLTTERFTNTDSYYAPTMAAIPGLEYIVVLCLIGLSQIPRRRRKS
ncbi:MAG: vWA domain-containing protein, partial [Candidatus Hodarchaeales archaeon]